jgi:flagellar hook assembly protein FlgD
LNIYNVQGQVVHSLVSGRAKPGYYSVEWHGTDRNARPVASAVYFYTLKVTGQDGKVMFRKRKKMILLK